VTFFYLHGKAIRNGSPAPTATQTDPISEHGGAVYVTHKEKVLDDCLLTISMIGVPVIAAGAILHFLMGVKLSFRMPRPWRNTGTEKPEDCLVEVFPLTDYR
jgi:hypothetical protein